MGVQTTFSYPETVDFKPFLDKSTHYPVIEILTNGCSPASDIKGTSAVGRNAVLIEQKNRTDTDRCRMIHDLKEALTLI